jgi:hypothetical protein
VLWESAETLLASPGVLKTDQRQGRRYGRPHQRRNGSTLTIRRNCFADRDPAHATRPICARNERRGAHRVPHRSDPSERQRIDSTLAWLPRTPRPAINASVSWAGWKGFRKDID